MHNIGLDASVPDTGAGRGAFKAPSLRNVGVRPTFMHDGRFTSLAQVMDFFDSGVRANPYLDARLKAADGTPKRLGLTSAQKRALVAFMNALTDSSFLAAVRFSNPFPRAVSIPPVAATPAAVSIQGNAYHPALLTVAAGTVITFTNLDNSRQSASFASSLITGTPIFSSGSQIVVMPLLAGTYGYQCAIHGAAMSGSIVVK
ncbi:hypothetical protein BH11GEM1_BH11GEM1_18690 [soil metagenome]